MSRTYSLGRCLAFGVLLAAGGCLPDVPTVELADWELDVDGARTPVRLPAHLGHGLDEHAATYETIDVVDVQPVKLTQTGAIMRTPLYMAPEVLTGASVGPPADLFSFGLIAYQVLGGPPIARERSVFRRADLRPFAELAPGLSHAAIEVLLRCVDEDPARRPSADEIVAALAPAARAAS